MLAAVGTLSLAAPSVISAQGFYTPGYDEGYRRGQSAGAEDARRGDRFEFTDQGDYRRGDSGYRSQYGNRDRYRDSFRFGYQEGYRLGYQGYDGYRNGRYGQYPPYSGRGGGPPYDGRTNRYDLAYQTGLNDGYEAGLDDGRDNRRFDPVSEGRFRSGDHGYRREYGPKEYYKLNYRDAFKLGYERGYNDGRRYDRRPGLGGIFRRF
jgi:hypothetical protein